MEASRWILLGYRLPREPSTPRITLWRKLRRLGVVQLLDSLAALPLDSRNREQLEWLADEIVEAGGEASLWVADATSAAQERDLINRLTAAIGSEYAAVRAEALGVAEGDNTARLRAHRRLRRDLRRIADRDYFPPPERELARDAVEALATAAELTEEVTE